MSDPNRTQLGVPPSGDPNRTIMGASPSFEATITIKPVQCPVCKSFNPPGVMFCIECGLIFDRALPDDAFGAPVVRLPCLVDGSGREHALRPGDNVVGRQADVMLDDPRVSRRHAVVRVADGAIEVEDLGSSNGTEVNGAKLEAGTAVALAAGDKVSFGGYETVFSTPGESAKTQMGLSGRTQAMTSTPSASPAAAMLVVGADEFPLRVGANTIGRKAGNDVVLAYPFVSGSHARVEVEEDGITFSDLGSTNGTFRGDDKLEPDVPTPVGEDDVLRIGDIELRFRRVQE